LRLARCAAAAFRNRARQQPALAARRTAGRAFATASAATMALFPNATRFGFARFAPVRPIAISFGMRIVIGDAADAVIVAGTNESSAVTVGGSPENRFRHQ